jgi:hypothetical protein
MIYAVSKSLILIIKVEGCQSMLESCDEMPDTRAYNMVLRACFIKKDLHQSRLVHEVRRRIYVRAGWCRR